MRGLRYLTLLTCALSLVATPLLAGQPAGQPGAASKTAPANPNVTAGQPDGRRFMSKPPCAWAAKPAQHAADSYHKARIWGGRNGLAGAQAPAKG